MPSNDFAPPKPRQKPPFVSQHKLFERAYALDQKLRDDGDFWTLEAARKAKQEVEQDDRNNARMNLKKIPASQRIDPTLSMNEQQQLQELAEKAEKCTGCFNLGMYEDAKDLMSFFFIRRAGLECVPSANVPRCTIPHNAPSLRPMYDFSSH